MVDTSVQYQRYLFQRQVLSQERLVIIRIFLEFLLVLKKIPYNHLFSIVSQNRSKKKIFAISLFFCDKPLTNTLCL